MQPERDPQPVARPRPERGPRNRRLKSPLLARLRPYEADRSRLTQSRGKWQPGNRPRLTSMMMRPKAPMDAREASPAETSAINSEMSGRAFGAIAVSLTGPAAGFW